MRIRRQLLSLAALLFLGLVSLGAAAPKDDLFGYYFPYPVTGQMPAAFADIDHLHLSTIDDRGGEVLKVPLYGFLRMKAKGSAPAVDFPLVAPTLNKKAFTFTTKAVDGVSYRFAGNFLKLGNFPRERPEGEIVLQGKLARMEGDKKAAETEVKFSYSAGD